MDTSKTKESIKDKVERLRIECEEAKGTNEYRKKYQKYIYWRDHDTSKEDARKRMAKSLEKRKKLKERERMISEHLTTKAVSQLLDEKTESAAKIHELEQKIEELCKQLDVKTEESKKGTVENKKVARGLESLEEIEERKKSVERNIHKLMNEAGKIQHGDVDDMNEPNAMKYMSNRMEIPVVIYPLDPDGIDKKENMVNSELINQKMKHASELMKDYAKYLDSLVKEHCDDLSSFDAYNHICKILCSEMMPRLGLLVRNIRIKTCAMKLYKEQQDKERS